MLLVKTKACDWFEQHEKRKVWSRTYVAVIEWVFDQHGSLASRDIVCPVPGLSLIMRDMDITLDDVMIE